MYKISLHKSKAIITIYFIFYLKIQNKKPYNLDTFKMSDFITVLHYTIIRVLMRITNNMRLMNENVCSIILYIII